MVFNFFENGRAGSCITAHYFKIRVSKAQEYLSETRTFGI